MQLRGQANGAVKHGTQEQKNGTGAVTEKRGFMRPAADYLRADSASIESLGILFTYRILVDLEMLCNDWGVC